jgi:hypothetical protein
MFPNFEVNFLYEEQRHKDEIRQIQLENEYRRAFRDASAAGRLNSRGLRARFGSIAARLSAIVRGRSREALESGSAIAIAAGAAAGKAAGKPDPCPDPCLAS